MNARVIAAVALLVVATSTAAWFGSSWFEKRRLERAAAASSAEAARIERTTPIIEAAPAPLPTGLPLLGPGGLDEEGFPGKWVDEPALRSLLAHQQYGVLSAYIAELVDAFDKDEKFERWPLEAFEAFHSGEPALGIDLDGWVAHDAGGFAARTARAEHWVAVGIARRGAAPAKDTSPEDFAAMREAFDHARPDVAAALAARPKLLEPQRLRIVMAAEEGEPRARDAARDAALAACPRCTEIRWTYLVWGTPRWGGTYEAMDAFARDSRRAASSSRMKSLLGTIDDDRAEELAKGDLEAAEAMANRALAAGDRAPFFITRAGIRIGRGDVAGAVADLDRAKALRPGSPRIAAQRAKAFFRLERYEDAGRELLEAARVDATDSIGRAYVEPIRQGLVSQAFRSDKAGRHDEALRLYDLAAEIAPRSRDTIAWRARAILGKDPPDEAALKREIDESPDDFRLRQRYDYLLARTKDYPKIAASWDAYLAKHPEDRRALVERAGTLAHLSRMPEAKRDAARSCELGSNEGCSLARQLGAR